MVSGNGRERKIRIALLIQYDGTMFNGWQSQKAGRTVQDEIERAIEIITKERTRIVASGRTDTGVHSLGQVAHFDIEKRIDIKRLCIGLNGVLDWDISIKNAYAVPQDFHARFSVQSREYIYLIYNHYQRNPFMNYRAMWVNYKLDIDFLREALYLLIGEKDFASFCKKRSSDINTRRRIEDIKLSRMGDLLIIQIRGNAFLHNMIRIIVGTVIEMFKNKMEPKHIINILAQRDRASSGITAPSYGLYLHEIEYNPPLSSMESAF
ncbi:MAG: tRNA pseudouridine(38-40) synthase TruA [Spirochaetota bacterium]|nr:tRNA pseudouridine(38-40) synthase TruA [Spirochaetota bacterium]